jgi:hypothetical protein
VTIGTLRYSTALMSIKQALRVAVIVDDPPRAPWQRRVLQACFTTAGAVEAVGPAAADLVIDLAHRTIDTTPRLGVWRYGFGDGTAVAGGAHGTLARLYRIDRDTRRAAVLREGWFRGPSDAAPGTENIGECVADWCSLVLRQILLEPSALASAPVVSLDGCDSALPPTREVSTVAAVRDAVRRWRRRERWTIGIVPATLDTILTQGELPEPHWLTATPPDRYFADPFPLDATGERITMLAEEYRYREGRGRIVRLEVDHDGCVRASRTEFDGALHLAYPFIMRDGETAYCVPDGAASGQACAFRIGPAADPKLTLLADFPAVDPTIVHHGGRWWMFCTRHGNANQTDLHLFEADAWRGPWRAHPLNPVKSDARSSRPAGAMFARQGALFRPAQDCSRRYGGAIAINRILDLTPTRFREETMFVLKPSPSWAWPDGMHTLNAIDDVVIVDALRVER